MVVSKETMAQHLAGMIAYPTVSYPKEEDMDFSAFEGLQAYLRKTYPLLHKTMTREIVGRAALLYHWESKAPHKRLPVMLAAHQDVVPAGNPQQWKYPPFGGQIADGFVYGRGASDSKSLIMAHMEAIEALIADGFEPDFDIYLGYGYNEEVGSQSAKNSAEMLCETLAARGVRLGILIDEGGFVLDGKEMGTECPVANVWVAEKGAASYEVYAQGEAGHTARPAEVNVIANLARAITRIADNPFPVKLLPQVAEEFHVLAPHAGPQQELFAHAEQRINELVEFCQSNWLTPLKLRTVVSMNEVASRTDSGKTPDYACMKLSCRLLPGDSAEMVLGRLQELAAPDAQVKLISGHEASPYSRTDGPAFAALSQAIRETYPDAAVLPSLLVAGTDARQYYPICDCVCRFTGFRDHYGMMHNGHSVNEHFPIETIDSSSRLFYHFLSKSWSAFVPVQHKRALNG